MANLIVAANVDFEELERVAKRLPQLLDNPPRLELRCGVFTCDSVDELMAFLKLRVAEDKPEEAKGK